MASKDVNDADGQDSTVRGSGTGTLESCTAISQGAQPRIEQSRFHTETKESQSSSCRSNQYK